MSGDEPSTTNRVGEGSGLYGMANGITGEYEFEVWQDGIPVAEVYSSNLDDALRDIFHYAAMYGQDGPVKIMQVQRREIILKEGT